MSEFRKDNSKIASVTSTIRGTLDTVGHKRVPAIFYRTEAGAEPVRLWLRAMNAMDRRLIGEDIRTVEFGWPIGMPTCRPLGDGLHEVRTNLPGNRTSRIFFYVDRMRRMVLLHGVIKKTQETRVADLNLARLNQRRHEKGLR